MAAAVLPTGPLPPLRFERRCLEKVWGGRRLERAVGLALPPALAIGETWEVSDRDDQPSVVAEGPLRGVRLRELVAERGADLLGRARPSADGRFPLLVKFLDAAQPLSVQVHPLRGDPARGEEAKTEAWLFLDAEPDARIWLGLERGARREAVERAAGTRDLVPLVRAWPARAGECVLVRGGTVHAIGAGVALLEVQENSDTTHRLYDWDRPGLDGRPRAIHVDAALRAIEWDAPVEGPRAPASEAVPGGRRAPLVDCPLFRMDRLEVEGALADDTRGVALLLAVLAGSGRLCCAAGDVALAPGQVWLVPASTGPFRLEPERGTLTTVRIETRP